MSRWYLDTSAALKLLVEEPESAALAALIDSAAPDLVACLLLETELRRIVHRNSSLTHDLVSNFLSGIGLYEVSPSLFVEAGLLPGPHLRSLDALHLAAAVRVEAECIATYDTRMADAARGFGLEVVAPQ